MAQVLAEFPFPTLGAWDDYSPPTPIRDDEQVDPWTVYAPELAV
jgi:hypothetical protein